MEAFPSRLRVRTAPGATAVTSGSIIAFELHSTPSSTPYASSVPPSGLSRGDSVPGDSEELPEEGNVTSMVSIPPLAAAPAQHVPKQSSFDLRTTFLAVGDAPVNVSAVLAASVQVTRRKRSIVRKLATTALNDLTGQLVKGTTNVLASLSSSFSRRSGPPVTSLSYVENSGDSVPMEADAGPSEQDRVSKSASTSPVAPSSDADALPRATGSVSDDEFVLIPTSGPGDASSSDSTISGCYYFEVTLRHISWRLLGPATFAFGLASEPALRSGDLVRLLSVNPNVSSCLTRHSVAFASLWIFTSPFMFPFALQDDLDPEAPCWFTSPMPHVTIHGNGTASMSAATCGDIMRPILEGDCVGVGFIPASNSAVFTLNGKLIPNPAPPEGTHNHAWFALFQSNPLK